MTARDPERNRAAWRYLIEKWQEHPAFADTAERLAGKHLR
jgi:hypothetical protein